MRKIYLLLLLFCTTATFSQDEFIYTWEVEDSEEDDLSIIVSVLGGPLVNDYNVDFGDGTILTNRNASTSHLYSESGLYTITITGTFSQIKFLGSPKLKSIEQWGTNKWLSMDEVFKGCQNVVINATDAPDLSLATNMNHCFREATSFNQSINHWDVSTIQNMQFVFYKAESFNQPLENWDVSNVSIMHNMFAHAYSFNQSLDSWNVSNTTNLSGMFQYAESFNQPLNSWNLASATSLSGIFLGATSFNQPLNNWNVSSVQNMANVFRDASVFNQPINNWNTSNVTRTDGMFQNAISFNQPLNDWELNNLTNTKSMFDGAVLFNQPLNNWNISMVTDMRDMFKNAFVFNQQLSNWEFNSSVLLSGFLSYSAIDLQNYDALLDSFVSQEISHLNIGAHTLKYCNQAARNFLISEKNFIFNGDILADNCTMSISISDLKNSISLYPNPTNDILNIIYSNNISINEISLYSLQGQKIHTSLQNFDIIHLEHLSSGIYILSINTDKGILSEKVIKK